MKQIIGILIATVLVFAVSVWAGSEDSSVANHRNNERNCACVNNNCGCCEYINLVGLRINGTVCTNFTYLSKDLGISITLTWNTYTVFNETVSAKNPPPVCFGIPEIEKIQAHICMRFYDLSFAREHFHGCIRLSVSINYVIRKSINVGCVNIPMKVLANDYTTKNGESLASTKEEPKKSNRFKDDIPYVNMI